MSDIKPRLSNPMESWTYIVGKVGLIEDEDRRNNVKTLLKKYREAFCDMPAATKNHHAYSGGLAVHTAEVLYWALHINKEIGDKFSNESIFMCAVFHDFSKVILFESIGPNKFKYRMGVWDLEHDVLCVSEAGNFGIIFTYNELMGIFQAHGGWAKIKKPSNQLASLIHAADMISSQLMGKTEMNG